MRRPGFKLPTRDVAKKRLNILSEISDAEKQPLRKNFVDGNDEGGRGGGVRASSSLLLAGVGIWCV